MVMDRQKLNEMDYEIKAYLLIAPEYRTKARRDELRSKLQSIKSGIWSGDKQAVEAARDKLGLI
jgi:hypothetical protein